MVVEASVGVMNGLRGCREGVTAVNKSVVPRRERRRRKELTFIAVVVAETNCQVVAYVDERNGSELLTSSLFLDNK